MVGTVMLDLKAKLAAAGLVTQKDVERAEKTKRKRGKSRRGGGGGGGRGPKLDVAALREQGKGQQYDAIRRLVAKARLDDPARPPSEGASAFHFPTATGAIGRIVLEPDVHTKVRDGGAAIVAFMSNHGLAHTAVPAKVGRSIAELFPLWLRVLKDEPAAGQIAPPEPSDPPAEETSAEPTAS